MAALIFSAVKLNSEVVEMYGEERITKSGTFPDYAPPFFKIGIYPTL